MPQFALAVTGAGVAYNPSTDCQGSFMASKSMVHNNCYNYSCDIATNTFAQPGRAHGYKMQKPYVGEDVATAAVADGLIRLPSAVNSVASLGKNVPSGVQGHFVALFISPAQSEADWHGDYHWVRCDDPLQFASWSQKDGGDEVTNFDFSGNPIANPPAGNWTMNQGPLVDGNPADVIVTYNFFEFLFVPSAGVTIA